jgi:hypothetical protein
MPKPADQIETPLTPDDIARYFELKNVLIQPLQDELTELEIRFKGELPVGEYPSKNGFIVKRWEQIGALKASEFLSAKPVKEFPELYADEPIIEKLLEKLPPESNPDLYQKVPAVAAIKELLNDEEKKVLFRQAQYLKISEKPAAAHKVSAVPNFDDENPENV